MAALDNVLERMKAIKEEPREPLTECPECGWTLDETPKGKHCKFCGWSEFL